MNKAEALAYLRRKVLLDKLADREIPPSQEEAVEELDKLNHSPEEEKKDLTSAETNV